MVRVTISRRHRVLVIMCVGMFLVLLDVTVINVALPAISAGLGAGIAQLQWIVTAYTITFAALLLPGGALGDIHGHRRMVLSGLVIFGIGSGTYGLAWTTDVLIVARALQGIGGAGALGTAVYGAIAGSPGHHVAFVSGIQVVGALGAALRIVGIGATVVCLPKFRIERSHESSAG